MCKKKGFLLMVLLGLTASAGAQNSPPVVEARALLAADGAVPGATLKAAAVAQIAPGYHINDHKPTLEYLIPTEWVLEGIPQVRVERVAYPKGQPSKFAFSDTALSVYAGALKVGALLKVSRLAKPGIYTLKGDFKYQACNDHACLPPKSLPLTLTVKVVGRGTPVKAVNAEVFRDVSFD